AKLDSLAKVEAEALKAEDLAPVEGQTAVLDTIPDSVRIAQAQQQYGAFGAATIGQEELVTVENDKLVLTVSTKGGAIKDVLLKDYFKVLLDTAKQEYKVPLHLLEDEKNRFEYELPVPSSPNGIVRSSDLYFTPKLEGQTLSLVADLGNGQSIEQVYSLQDGRYLLDYDVRFNGLQQVFANNAQTITLNWVNYLDKLELNEGYERNYTSIYYKPTDDTSDRCSCTGTDEVEAKQTAIKWVSAANQFFNTTILAQDRFSGAVLNTEVLEEEADDLKKVAATIQVPYNHSPNETVSMQLYVGPNDFERLEAVGYELTDVIPYGRSVFGAINRWIIRPLFNFFDGITGNKGIAILLLTLLVKILVFPLTFKMLKSQSKMQAMKPYLEK
ncbi:MAG: membrane protein insertase YidC, partial [Bacteroidota bacterium]